nr:MAG TPA: hypothetical protein [Caudoviricetes sp.]
MVDVLFVPQGFLSLYLQLLTEVHHIMLMNFSVFILYVSIVIIF